MTSHASLAQPSRTVIALLSPCGGAGVSTLAALLADHAPGPLTLVLDLDARVSSPWPGWVSRLGSGHAGLATFEASDLPTSASALRTGFDRVSVLTDVRPRDARPLAQRPLSWWSSAVAQTFHSLIIADTATSALPELLRASVSGDGSELTRWLHEPTVAPVLAVPASARGIDDALMTITLLEHLTSRTPDLTVAVVGISCSMTPRSVRARLELLRDRVGTVIHVHHERRLIDGLTPRLGRVGPRVRRAVAAVHAHAVSVTTPPTANAADTTKENRHVQPSTRRAVPG